MRKALIFMAIFLALLLAPTGVRYLQYHQLTGVARTAPPVYDPATIQTVPTPVAGTFVDEPQLGSGAILLDMAHDNQFHMDEIRYLDGRLAARGFELRPHTGSNLAAALRSVTAYIVISPIREFSRAEVQAVSDFVDRGGRLLLIGDPTNFTVSIEEDFFGFDFRINSDDIPLNSLANRFNIIFQGDYLYNTVESEGNFRNIILRSEGFSDHTLLNGVDQLAFYGAHSLQLGADSQPLITADGNTWSSATDRAGDLVVAATSREGRVVALGDYHFLRQPYYTAYDNGRFIAALADFLTRMDDRRFILGDFPYFYQQPVSLVYVGQPDLGPGAFGEIIGLQSAFRQVGQSLNLAATHRKGYDALYLGLYNQADEIADLLAEYDISLIIEPPINPEAEANDNGDENDIAVRRLIQSDLGPIQMAGTALILLHEDEDGRRVIVLAASTDGLQTTLDRLLNVVPLTADYALADCLLQDHLALCPTFIPDEAVEAELDTGGVPEATTPAPAPGAGDLPDLDIDVVDRGPITIGQTVDDTLLAEQAHAWIFTDGPAVIDILVESSTTLDGVIELYGPDNELIEREDRAFTGGDELMAGVEIPDNGRYVIIVRDYFDEGGDYTLTVSEGSLTEPGEGRGIFILVDERGTPLSGGITSATTIAGLLSDQYEVTIWSLTEDGDLSDGDLDGYDLLIWDSGDYRNQEEFFDETIFIILDYADAGGSIFITGSAPIFFAEEVLSPLTDLEVSGDDPILLNQLEEGQIITLDQSYEVILSDEFEPEPGTSTLFLRGPQSSGSGAVIALASVDELDAQRTLLLLLPFVALPSSLQPILLENFMAWFGL